MILLGISPDKSEKQNARRKLIFHKKKSDQRKLLLFIEKCFLVVFS